MSERKNLPRCPWCGALMQPKKELYGVESYGFNENDATYWYECNNWKCGTHSPLRETAEEAYKAAVALREGKNRVLTLDEVTADAEKEDWSFIWIERKYDEKYALQYCAWYATSTWVILVLPANEKKIYELKSDYGKTWRCWLRKPTLEEMAETPWGAKHNEH